MKGALAPETIRALFSNLGGFRSHLRSFASSPLDNLDEKVIPLDYLVEGAMAEQDLVPGTLEMLVLKTLALEPMHGYGIALRIEQISARAFRVNPGSLLPALSRMERAGQLKAEWRTSENNRRAKYYAVTVRGLKALERERQQWDRQVEAIGRILEA
jgi:PadR family transcriptional regulator PadR